MCSLRTFHIFFILVVFVAVDMFGAWAIWRYAQEGEVLALVAGILAFGFGFALIGYVLWMLHKFNQAKIE